MFVIQFVANGTPLRLMSHLLQKCLSMTLSTSASWTECTQLLHSRRRRIEKAPPAESTPIKLGSWWESNGALEILSSCSTCSTYEEMVYEMRCAALLETAGKPRMKTWTSREYPRSHVFHLVSGFLFSQKLRLDVKTSHVPSVPSLVAMQPSQWILMVPKETGPWSLWSGASRQGSKAEILMLYGCSLCIEIYENLYNIYIYVYVLVINVLVIMCIYILRICMIGIYIIIFIIHLYICFVFIEQFVITMAAAF